MKVIPFWPLTAPRRKPNRWRLGTRLYRPPARATVQSARRFSHLASLRGERSQSVGSAYGLEHVPERSAFLPCLREANEEDENAYPVNYCVKLYEELNAVLREAIRESRRQLCAKLGTENPRLEDLKLIALAPSDDGTPNFEFPRVWDLKDPQGYFQTVVLPRQQRAMTWLLNKQLHEQALGSNRQPNKAAGADTGSYEDEVETDPKAGKPVKGRIYA